MLRTKSQSPLGLGIGRQQRLRHNRSASGRWRKRQLARSSRKRLGVVGPLVRTSLLRPTSRRSQSKRSTRRARAGLLRRASPRSERIARARCRGAQMKAGTTAQAMLPTRWMNRCMPAHVRRLDKHSASCACASARPHMLDGKTAEAATALTWTLNTTGANEGDAREHGRCWQVCCLSRLHCWIAARLPFDVCCAQWLASLLAWIVSGLDLLTTLLDILQRPARPAAQVRREWL